MVSEKFKYFVTILKRNYITDKCDAEKTARNLWSKFSYRYANYWRMLWIISCIMHYMKN